MVFLVFPKNVRDKFNFWRERNILLKILFRTQTKQLLSLKRIFETREGVGLNINELKLLIFG